MKKTVSVLAILALMTGCTTMNPYTGQTQTAKATWGTAIGAATGALIGSTKSSTGALVGGLAGAAVGGGVGYYLDAQAAELRAELVSTGVQVIEEQDSIRLIMPGNITFNTDSADINSSFYPVLNSVAKVMEDAIPKLNPGGRLAVITFHSLEDRMVKRAFAEYTKGCTCPPEFPVCICGKKPKLKLLTRKPIVSGEAELEENPRSRSAKLRVCEKI